jgi:translocation and assembly module TamA
VGPSIIGIPTGGESLLIFNEEVRMPLYRSVGAIGFFDAGNVFALPDRPSITNLQKSVGFGLRLATPVGLLRIDAGFPLQRQPGDPRLRWIFSVGQTF